MNATLHGKTQQAIDFIKSFRRMTTEKAATRIDADILAENTEGDYTDLDLAIMQQMGRLLDSLFPGQSTDTIYDYIQEHVSFTLRYPD